MSKVKVRKMFPGAVTSQGFFSYYQYIINHDAEHIYVIKGGPGVGKSTFMKKIGQSMVERGYDIEYHCCSSDNNSIDGLVIPDLNIALLDGTAPHIVDPKNPGAVDEIINLGEFWDDAKMVQSKNEILDCNYRVGKYFQSAYFALKEAKTAMEEWEFYVKEYQDWTRINHLYLKIESELFSKIVPKSYGSERHLFAWAHSPEGKTQFIDTLITGVKNLYVIEGQPGTGKSSFLGKIRDKALIYGLNIETYHNTLDPTQIDLLLLSDIGTALVINSEPYSFTTQSDANKKRLDFNQYLAPGISIYASEIADCSQRVNDHIARALRCSKQAKAAHDLMETYYIPAMDFTAIERKRLSVLENILKVAEKQAIAVNKLEGSGQII